MESLYHELICFISSEYFNHEDTSVFKRLYLVMSFWSEFWPINTLSAD